MFWRVYYFGCSIPSLGYSSPRRANAGLSQQASTASWTLRASPSSATSSSQPQCFPATRGIPSRVFCRRSSAMAQYYPQQQQQQGYGPQAGAQNLQFFPSSYSSVSGHTTPSQASYGAGFGGAPNPSSQAYPVGSGYGGFASPTGGVSGRMGEQGGLRTGWLAAFGTEGYDGEPPLLEELGVNFEHIRTKVSSVERGGFRRDDAHVSYEDTDGPVPQEEYATVSTSCKENTVHLSNEKLTALPPRL